jgi:hypothetical protein
MREISFTEEEANALINLIDIAVKTNGLRSAGDGLALVSKLQQAFQSPVESNPVNESMDLPEPGSKKKK